MAASYAAEYDIWVLQKGLRGVKDLFMSQATSPVTVRAESAYGINVTWVKLRNRPRKFGSKPTIRWLKNT